MVPEEGGNEVRELVWEMSKATNRILIVSILLILALISVLGYYGVK